MKRRANPLSLFSLFDGSRIYGRIKKKNETGWTLTSAKLVTEESIRHSEEIELSSDAVRIWFTVLRGDSSD